MTMLIYIGDDFYRRSGSAMSSIYEEGTWRRYDWGLVSVDLQNGQSVSIRPANGNEMKWAKWMLKDASREWQEISRA